MERGKLVYDGLKDSFKLQIYDNGILIPQLFLEKEKFYDFDNIREMDVEYNCFDDLYSQPIKFTEEFKIIFKINNEDLILNYRYKIEYDNFLSILGSCAKTKNKVLLIKKPDIENFEKEYKKQMHKSRSKALNIILKLELYDKSNGNKIFPFGADNFFADNKIRYYYEQQRMAIERQIESEGGKTVLRELYQNFNCKLCNYEFTARILINDLNKDFTEVYCPKCERYFAIYLTKEMKEKAKNTHFSP